MIEFLTYVFCFAFFGAAIGKLLDFCMDYGHVFGGIRLYLARKAAKRLKVLDTFNEQIKEVTKTDLGFSTTLDQVDQIYWTLHKDSFFKGWICIFCLIVRLVFIASIGGALIWLLISGFTWLTLISSLVFIPCACGTAYFFTLLMNKLNG